MTDTSENGILHRLTKSQVIAENELTQILEALPEDERPTDLPSAAQLLLKHRKITDYQARVIARGKGHMLLMKNYLILDKIGKGGTGTVFRARHLRMNRIVAIKVLSRDHDSCQKSIERFFREMRTAGMLNHPNVASAFDADEAYGHWFLVSEYINGENLGELIAENGAMAPMVAVDVILQAAIGLEFAHEAGVIHRDIKPANLMMDCVGNVKVLDLGLASFQSEKDRLRLTNTGTIIGTPHYMPPEQAKSAQLVDARSDIYSLGCTLHYLLTAAPVYDEDSVMSTLMAHKEKPIPELGQKTKGITPSLQFIFEKMVAKEPDERYQRMAHVVEDLQLLKRGKPLRYADCSSEILSDIRLKEFLEMLDRDSGEIEAGDYFLDDTQNSMTAWNENSVGLSSSFSNRTPGNSPASADQESGMLTPRSHIVIVGTTVVLLSIVSWIIF